MELKGLLTPEEQHLLGVEDSEIDEETALHMLMDVAGRLNRIEGRMQELRGGLTSEKGELNNLWHQTEVLSGLKVGLTRLAGVEQPVE